MENNTTAPRTVSISYNSEGKIYLNYKSNDTTGYDYKNNIYEFKLNTINATDDKVYGRGFIIQGEFDCVLYSASNPSDSLILSVGEYKGFLTRR